MPPSIWTYSDRSDRGFGLFKRHILRELAAQGWTVGLSESPLLDPRSKTVLRNQLLERRPDWVLLINQSAAQLYEYLEIPLFLLPLSCKKWIWYLDDPHFFIDRPFEANEYVFCFDTSYMNYIQTFHPAILAHLPLACDETGTGLYDSRFACEVCFVGGVIDQSQRRAQLPADMRRYVDELVEMKLVQREKTFHELAVLHPIAPGKKIEISPPVAHYLYWEANNRYRIRTLEALLDFDLRIYGNEDWPRVLNGSPLLQRFCGPADPVRDLPSIFASAKINLNIHSVQCRGSLNQRDFNAPVAGGFLLSDWVPAAGRFFQPGEEAVFWADGYDLRAKVTDYLDHPEKRKQITGKGRERVLRDHVYSQRVARCLEILRSQKGIE